MLASSESEEVDDILIENDFGPDEAMSPLGVDLEGMSQDGGLAVGVCPTEEDQSSCDGGLQVEFPVAGEGTANGGVRHSRGSAFSQCGHIVVRPLLQLLEGPVLVALPDLGLPQTIETLDGRLESRFVGRRKDGCDPQAQAQSNDSTDGIGILARPGESIVVVELGIAGQSELPPVFHQAADNIGSGDRWTGPNTGNSSQNRDGGQDAQVSPSSNRQAFDGVEGIDLGSHRSDCRKIPALRRRRSADTASPIENTLSFEDAANRSHRRTGRDRSRLQFASDGRCSDFSEDTLLQLSSQGQHTRFDSLRRAGGRVGLRRQIVPTDAVQSLPAGPTQPMLDRRKRDAPMGRRRSLRHPLADGRDHLATLSRAQVFQPCSRTPVFSSTLPNDTARRSEGQPTPVGLRPPSVGCPSLQNPKTFTSN